MGYEDEKTAQNFAPTRPNDLVRIPARLLVLNHVLNIGGGGGGGTMIPNTQQGQRRIGSIRSISRSWSGLASLQTWTP